MVSNYILFWFIEFYLEIWKKIKVWFKNTQSCFTQEFLKRLKINKP